MNTTKFQLKKRLKIKICRPKHTTRQKKLKYHQSSKQRTQFSNLQLPAPERAPIPGWLPLSRFVHGHIETALPGKADQNTDGLGADELDEVDVDENLWDFYHVRPPFDS